MEQAHVAKTKKMTIEITSSAFFLFAFEQGVLVENNEVTTLSSRVRH